jgi:hypothetical protein
MVEWCLTFFTNRRGAEYAEKRTGEMRKTRRTRENN